MTRQFTTIITAVAIASSALIAGPAAAQSTSVRTATVEYGDINLGTAKGQARLDRRIKAAARQVCGNPMASGSRIPSTSVKRCYAEAIAKTRAHVVNLTAADNRRGG